jgi:uncharacterized sodium:solute symporter family permease YidK
MAEGSDVNYWNLVIIGIFIVGAIMLWAIVRNKKDKVDPNITERGTREVYEEEQRMHQNDRNSGL